MKLVNSTNEQMRDSPERRANITLNFEKSNEDTIMDTKNDYNQEYNIEVSNRSNNGYNSDDLEEEDETNDNQTFTNSSINLTSSNNNIKIRTFKSYEEDNELKISNINNPFNQPINPNMKITRLQRKESNSNSEKLLSKKKRRRPKSSKKRVKNEKISGKQSRNSEGKVEQSPSSKK